MMIMKRRRKFLLLEKGSSHLLRLRIKVKGNPIPKMTRLRKPRRRRKEKSLRLKEPYRRIKERRTREEKRRKMKKKDL
jgi:hypothetical protein